MGLEGSIIDIRDIKSGGKVTNVPANPEVDHYTFDGWFLDDGFTQAVNFASATFTEDTIIYAKLDIDNYTITYDVKGGDAPIASETIEYGSKFTIPDPDPVKTGDYEFGGWFTDDGVWEKSLISMSFL